MKKGRIILIVFGLVFAFTATTIVTTLFLYPNLPSEGVLGLEGVPGLDDNTLTAVENPNNPPEDNSADNQEDPAESPVHTNSIIIQTDDDLTVEGFMVNNNELPWNLQLVNRYNFLDEDFAPDTVPIGDGHFFDTRAAQQLLDMLEAASVEGLSPVVRSSYRSVSRQQVLFNNQIQRHLDEGLSEEAAFEAARRVVAEPGSSEHNLGLAVDIVSLGHGGLTAAFGQTSEGIWLAQNAHRFGFILRYPDHKQHITHIIYEPWHFRYVGTEHATVMFENDWVLEEYIYHLAAVN